MRKILAIAAALFIGGCQTVKHVPLAEAAGTQMQGKTFAVVRYTKPDFMAFTAGKAAFGLIGAAAMIEAGNKIVEQHAIPDPAIQISDTIAASFVSQRGLKRVDIAPSFKNDKIPLLVAAYPGVDYLLDVRTMGWMFAYYPTNWTGHRVIYQARFRLIDTATQKTVAETACTTTQGNDKDPPSKDELLANNAELLKSLLVKGAVTCTDLLTKDLLKLKPAPVTAQAATTG